MKKLFTPLKVAKTKKKHKVLKPLTGFKNKKVTIMGLGLHGGGAGVAKFFAKQGAKVLVTDLKTEEQLKESLKKLRGLDIEYVFGSHRQKDFVETDLVIKNPGVPGNSPYLQIARDNKVPIKTDIGIFFDLCQGEIIGVTGSKGKSTTATLIYLILKSEYPNTYLAGNIGVSPLEFLPKINKKSKVVLELSSFELEDLQKSPKIAVITTLYPEHLDRYKDFEEYRKAKMPIFQHQRKQDILILNYDNPEAIKYAPFTPSRTYFYSQKALPGKFAAAAFLKENQIFFDGEKEAVCEEKDVKIRGRHNLGNVLAAVSAVKFFKTPSKNIKRVLRRFEGVPYRQDFIKEINGVKYFNDTTATMPEAVIQAIERFSSEFPKSKIVLIVGGQGKGLNYRNLTDVINKKIKNLVMLPGTASEEIKNNLESKVNLVQVKSMDEAVEKSSALALPGDLVLLSPGAASFNLFKNEFDRGEQFNNALSDIKKINPLNLEPKNDSI